MEEKTFNDFQSFWESLSTTNDDVDLFDQMMGPSASGSPSSAVSPSQTQGGGNTRFLFDYDVLLGNNLGVISSRFQPPPKETVIKTTKSLLEHIDREYGPEDFVQMMIVSFPYREEYKSEYNELFDQGEDIIFENKNSNTIKTSAKISETSQLLINLIRVHRRAEEGDFNTAGILLDDLCDNWIDKVPERQSTILFHSFVHNICLGNWEKSHAILKRMWAYIKLAPNQDRYNSGLWDDWFAVHIILWFFAKHINRYYVSVGVNLGLHSVAIIGGRKATFLKRQTPRDIADLITVPYYNKAKEVNPELPNLS